MPKNETFFSKCWQNLKFQYFYLVLVHTIATHSQIKRKFFFFSKMNWRSAIVGTVQLLFFYTDVVGVLYSGFLAIYKLLKNL